MKEHHRRHDRRDIGVKNRRKGPVKPCIHRGAWGFPCPQLFPHAFLVFGAFFVLFYTFPLKYIGLGEVAVLLVWGPLMVGGAYHVITGRWDWQVALASLPYALGTTTVLFERDTCEVAPSGELMITVGGAA